MVPSPGVRVSGLFGRVSTYEPAAGSGFSRVRVPTALHSYFTESCLHLGLRSIPGVFPCLFRNSVLFWEYSLKSESLAPAVPAQRAECPRSCTRLCRARRVHALWRLTPQSPCATTSCRQRPSPRSRSGCCARRRSRGSRSRATRLMAAEMQLGAGVRFSRVCINSHACRHWRPCRLKRLPPPAPGPTACTALRARAPVLPGCPRKSSRSAGRR